MVLNEGTEAVLAESVNVRNEVGSDGEIAVTGEKGLRSVAKVIVAVEDFVHRIVSERIQNCRVEKTRVWFLHGLWNYESMNSTKRILSAAEGNLGARLDFRKNATPLSLERQQRSSSNNACSSSTGKALHFFFFFKRFLCIYRSRSFL